MQAEDVTATRDLALRASGLDQTRPTGRPPLLSDNGSRDIAGELAEWLEDRKIKHGRGAPYHPMTQGRIERWHQTLKNRILLQNAFLPGGGRSSSAASFILRMSRPIPNTSTRKRSPWARSAPLSEFRCCATGCR